MKILLTTLNAKYIHLNLAIRLLYDLNKEDERLSWKEFTIKDDPNSVAQNCATYDLVCFSCYIWNINQTLLVCEKIKSLNPSTRILLGGPEVSYDYQEVITLDCVDYIIPGEGEIPFQRFLSAFPAMDSLPGVIHKKGHEIIYLKELINFDINQYHGRNPYQYDPPETLVNRVLYIETSRGCPYKCEFCLASLDNKVRYLPMGQIKANLLYLMQYGRVIKFLDRTFNVKKDFTLEIFQFILEHARPINVFQFEITADILHPDIIRFIQEKIPKGMFRFEIGIQTVNQKANLEVSRKQNFEKTKGVILALRDYVEMHLDLIVGLPLDYWNDIRFSFEEVFKLYPPELQLGFLKFLKGTPVREKYEQHGFEFDPVAPYQIIRSNYLSKDELDKITQLEHALEIYWNKKRLLHTLTYVTKHYSIFDFLLQLGIYFGEKSNYIKHSLNDIYEVAYSFLATFYPEDAILKTLVALDYYLQHKIRPAERFLMEIPRKEKMQLAQEMKLPLNKFRYIMLPVDFDLEHFLQHHEVLSGSYLLLIEYSGTHKPRIYKQLDQQKMAI